jgi:hypothetical protein
MSAVTGLVPLKMWRGHYKVWSDGYWLLRLWTASKEEVAELASNPEWKRALEWLQSDSSQSAASLKAVFRPTPPEQTGSHPNSSETFLEQRARLTSRLLRKIKVEEVSR